MTPDGLERAHAGGMNAYRLPAPDLPTDRPGASRFRQMMARSCIALVRADGDARAAAMLARALWPQDKSVQDWLTRAPVTPTSTTTSGVPTATPLGDILPLLGPSSASGGVFSGAIKLNLAGASSMLIPEIVNTGSGVGFVAQGGPIPMKVLSFSSVPLGVKKLALGVVMTRELFTHSNAETMISQVLAENLTLGIDSILFDATTADATRPAGLKFGVSATPATGPGNQQDAMLADLAGLAAIIAPVAGLQIAFVASPKQAIKIQYRKTSDLIFPVFSSAALPDTQVMAVGLNALAVAGDSEPRFEIAKSGAVHLEQDAPAQLSIVGTPTNVVSAPIQSLDQTDSISLRLIMELNWVLRTTGAIAWTTGVNW
jgi:hypothetical protein